MELAQELIRPLGRRFDHVMAVGALASRVAMALPSDRRSTLVAAAYLHDVGYASELVITGFHPLDGARFLRKRGHDELAGLVAHHSGARREAKLRGLEAYEDECPFEDSPLHPALTSGDLTTGPDGRHVTLEERTAEIKRRYGAGHVVATAIEAGRAEFENAVAQTELMMELAGVPVIESSASRR